MASLVKCCASLVSRQVICRRMGLLFHGRQLSTDTPSQDNPPIPVYKWSPNETIENRRARLLYQSRKRGMLENGLLLSTFASKYLDSLNEQQLKLYDELINLPSNDWDIYYWMTGTQPTPPEFDHDVMDMMKEHTRNENREERFHQPALKPSS